MQRRDLLNWATTSARSPVARGEASTPEPNNPDRFFALSPESVFGYKRPAFSIDKEDPLAGFKTHITTSSLLGLGYGTAGYLLSDAPWSTCVLAGGLCSVSGMLPDLDSDSGVPLRESIAFAAAVVPMLMLGRFESLGLPKDLIVICGAGIYLFVRFGLARILKKFTVHRGMFHSIPAALIAGLLAFLIYSCARFDWRIFVAAAVMLGFMSHLLLDEFFSLGWGWTGLKVKRSFGTATKFWGKHYWANVLTYGQLVALAVLAAGDPVIMQHIEPHRHEIRQALDRGPLRSRPEEEEKAPAPRMADVPPANSTR